MKSIIVKYYEGLVENHDPLDEKKVMAYQDLEKLLSKNQEITSHSMKIINSSLVLYSTL